jgi:hypothetical protein
MSTLATTVLLVTSSSITSLLLARAIFILATISAFLSAFMPTLMSTFLTLATTVGVLVVVA